jgi:hypothetical protein
LLAQDVRRAIRTLREDSKRKLDHDAEVHGAVEQLHGQVESLREGLATLSEAFIQERAAQSARISQVRRLDGTSFIDIGTFDA